MEITKIVYIIIIVWLGIIGVFVLSNDITMKTGKEVMLKIIPIDPRDLLRGDYVILNYEISSLPRNNEYKADQVVYAVLKTDDKNVATVDYIDKQYPKNKIFIKGIVRNKGWNSRIEYGIESYFVKEKTGRQLQNNLRRGAHAKVLIDKNGKAKVKELVY